MKLEPATTRVEASVLREIDEIAEREGMDRATLLRQLIGEGLLAKAHNSRECRQNSEG